MRAASSMVVGIAMGALAFAGLGAAGGAAARAPATDPADAAKVPAPVPLPVPARAAMQRWDHFCTTVVPGSFTDTARKYGNDGWEMVSMISYETPKLNMGAYPFNVDVNIVMCFKRPQPAP